jgi:hypothetical protein
MTKPWRRQLIADLGADKKLDRKIPVRLLFVETPKTDGNRNPIHAVSYASVAAGRRKSNDDEEKLPLTTLLKGLARLARKLQVDQRQKPRNDPSPTTKIKQLKAKISCPLHDKWCCNCTKTSRCKTIRCECSKKQRACTSGKCRDGCCERVGVKSPSETQIEDNTKAHDADQSAIPDLTPETVEPEPSSGEATNPINLPDEADENPAPHFQRVIAVSR